MAHCMVAQMSDGLSYRVAEAFLIGWGLHKLSCAMCIASGPELPYHFFGELDKLAPRLLQLR